jgi:Cft2 family RNA processing exonuclease
MGSEAACTAQFGKEQSKGKALLETSEIIFRGDFRLKIPFSTIKSAKAVVGELRLQTSEGLVVFQLGAAAEKWCDKILHPKSRIEKLGVKPGARVSLLGGFDPDFLKEIAALTKSVSKDKTAKDTEHIFFAADSKEDLGALSKISKSMQGAAALWIVYPKGQKQITENDVLAAGRKVGLKDVKVVGFSSTHTALKFVIPVDKR